MRSVLSIILIYSLAITSVFAQSVNPNDNLKIGNKSSSSDKGITFDTNDGVNNKKLLVEKISKKLKWDGNSVQIGDGSSSSDKELVIAGALKSLKYNGTTGEFEFNDDLKLSGELKSDILRAINTEVAVKSLLRAEQGIKVGTGSNEIRVNAGNLEFSNDGVLYKKFGTGTGNGGSSGISILENASFEDGITTGWTSSGGTFSQETYTNSVEGSTKYARFVATGAGQYFETTLKAIPDNFSGGCQADFKKVNVSTDDLFKVEVLDSSLNVLTFGNVKKSSWVKFPTINFPCPTAGSTVKLRVISLAAGTIEVDDAYLGSNQNIVNLSQAKLFGTISYSSAAGCLWQTTSGVFANFAANTGCPAAIISGAASAPVTKIPAISFSQMPAGDYVFIATGMFELNSPSLSAFAYLRFSDGTTNSSPVIASRSFVSGVANLTQTNTVIGKFSYATMQNNVTVNLQGYQNGANTLNIDNQTTSDFTIQVYYYPSSTETAVNTDQASWFIDANIGGANTPLPGVISTYTEITNSSLDLVVNTSKGSANAQIACASGTDSTGLTCSGANESIGVTFTPPNAGVYEACFSFSHYTVNAEATFQLIETSPTSSAIISEGGQKSPSYNTATADIAHKVCGTFAFSNTSRKTIRLATEVTASGTSNNILADRASGNGQRDIYIIIRPLLSAYNRPILTGDQVTTPGASKPETFSVSYGTTNATTACSASPCSYLDQIGNAVTSITRSGTGSYVLNFSKTYSKIKCTGNARGTSVYTIMYTHTTGNNVSSLNFGTDSPTGPATDSFGTVHCHGITQ